MVDFASGDAFEEMEDLSKALFDDIADDSDDGLFEDPDAWNEADVSMLFPSLVDSEELSCPYCGRVQECHEPDVIDACCANTECEFCEKLFEYSVTVTRSYSASKMETEEKEE